MTITVEDRAILIENHKIILDINRGYAKGELEVLYALHNRIYSTTKVPNGCGSCIRSVIVSLQKAISKIL